MVSMLAVTVPSVTVSATNNTVSPNAIETAPFYYTPYDYYNSTSLAPTNHYVAAIAPSGTSFGSFFNVYFYLNNTIVPSNATDINKFSLGTGFSFLIASLSDYSTSVKSLSATVMKSGTPAPPSKVIEYYLEGVENNVFVTNEYNLLCRTSESFFSPSKSVPTSSGVSYGKVVYALGDVDRNGVIDNDDSNEVQKYLLSLGMAIPGRTTTEVEYDELAFKLAADFNQNGTVDMGDVNSINLYINNH